MALLLVLLATHVTAMVLGGFIWHFAIIEIMAHKFKAMEWHEDYE